MSEDVESGNTHVSAKGNYIAQAIDGSTAIVAVYTNVSARPVEQATVDVALQKLAELPADTPHEAGAIPAGSRLPALTRNPSFVDREAELGRVAALLKGSKLATAAITGLGGIGKSQLAIEFVYRYGEYFSGGVFWLSFADANTIPAEVAACHTALGQELRLDATTFSLAEQVQLVLSAWQNTLPRLLVFDNCEEERLLAQWRPPIGGCRMLVTSRREVWHPDLNVQILPLEVLPREESIVLLGKYDPELSATDRDAIANELGDLPLALYLAGKYLNEYQGSPLGEPVTYLASLRSMTPLHHPSLADEELTYTTGHVENVERTFAASYERLNPSDTIDDAALKVLARAAYFAPGEPIPRDLLRASMGEAGNDLLEAAVVEALQRLNALGLLDKQLRNSYRMHRLVAEFVQERSVSTDTQALSDVEQVLLERAQQLNDAGYPAPLLALQPHLRVITNKALQSEDELAAKLCNELGMHLRSIAAYSQAETYLKNARAIRERLLGPEHPDVAISLNNLAGLYYYQGKYEQAEPLYQRALTIRQKTLGPEHPDVAASLNNLALHYDTQGKYEQAEPLYQQALAIRQKTLGPEHPDVAASLNNLALLYYYEGRYEQAEPLYQQALAFSQKALGPEHPYVAKSFINLAALYSTQSKYEQAEPLYQQALAISQKALGPEHPDVATSLNNLAVLYQQEGKYEQAEPLYQQALAIRQKALGLEHPYVAFTLKSYATLLRRMNRTEEAVELEARAQTIRAKQTKSM